MLGKMTRPQQQWLSDKVLGDLETFRATHQLEHQQMIYWLVSFVWGFARRLGWRHQAITQYALATFEACDNTERASLSPSSDLIPPRG